MKLLIVFGLIIGWFVVGFIINLLVYAGTPVSEQGHSQTAKSLHLVLNIATVLGLLSTILS